MTPQELLEKYPYFAYAALKALPLTEEPEERMRLKAIISANIGSLTDLREILGLNSESLADFYPAGVAPTLSTEDTIDTFIARFGGGETGLLPGVAPAIDYASSLMADLPADEPLPDLGLPADSPFLNTEESRQPHSPESDPQPDSKSTATSTPSEGLTESFAKILIKNRNYTKALEIIEDLNLKNPEKSIYFADQIRFLKKLIIAQSKSSGASR